LARETLKVSQTRVDKRRRRRPAQVPFTNAIHLEVKIMPLLPQDPKIFPLNQAEVGNDIHIFSTSLASLHPLSGK
jgi:hypothetical protein